MIGDRVPAQVYIPAELGTRSTCSDGLRNTGDNSGRPSRFTRDQRARKCSTAFLINAQGEDVVPACARRAGGAARNEMPRYKELDKIRATLEKHLGRCRFRVHHESKVFMLKPATQTHPHRAVRSPSDGEEKLIDWKTAIMRVRRSSSIKCSRRSRP